MRSCGRSVVTAYDAFQEATCDIEDGNYAAASRWIDAAIRQIDADGVDAALRPDLLRLRDIIASKAGA